MATWRQEAATFGASHAGYHEFGIQAVQYKSFPAATWEYGYDESGAHLHAIDLGMVTGKYGFALNFQTPEGAGLACSPSSRRSRPVSRPRHMNQSQKNPCIPSKRHGMI